MTAARVLIVEDDADNLAMMAAILTGMGYLCDEALSGADALAHVARGCPDVILSDWVMPGMGGLALVKALRDENTSCTSAIFIITGHACVSVAVAAIQEGADECLSKPIDWDILRARLERRGFYGHTIEAKDTL